MPTYGRRKTAEDFLTNSVVFAFRRQIQELEERQTALKLRLENAVARCEHHFIPPPQATLRMKETLVAGTFDAGNIHEYDDASDVLFILNCAKCGMEKKISIAEHCPLCAHTVHGEWGHQHDLEKYFGKRDFVYYVPWHISCTNPACNFKAVGLKWDQ